MPGHDWKMLPWGVIDESLSFLTGFGCAGNAFGYSTLNSNSTRTKNADADAANPNLYTSVDDVKDNRQLENIYDEIQKRQSLARAKKASSGALVDLGIVYREKQDWKQV